MLEDLLIKINVDMSPLMAAAPKIDANLKDINANINRINTTPVKLDLADPSSVVGSLENIKSSIDGIHHAAVNAEFTSRSLARTLTAISYAAAPISLVSESFAGIRLTSSLAAQGARDLAAGFAVIGTVTAYMASGLSLLLAPLQGLIIIPKLIAASWVVMFAVVLGPFRAFIATVTLAAKGVWALAQPFIGVAAAVFKFKAGMHSLQIQAFLLAKALKMLPPETRAVVVGLVALGYAGRIGRAAISALKFAIRQSATVLMFLSNPLRAAGRLILDTSKAMYALTTGTLRASKAMLQFAGTQALAGLKGLGSAVGSVAGMIGGKLIGAAKAGIATLGALGAAAAAWGIKMAVKAEQSTVVFGTMLKDMKAGKALMNELEGWSGASLFDPEEIQLSGVLLFKAGIAAQDITGKLDQLGNIAAATKTPLDDLAKIYQQGMNQGAFQQDKINQLSDRGIAIYEGLTAATGKSGAALKEMISDGKIGPAEMNAAIEHLTTGTGIYAGAMTNLSQTTGGMWSGMMNKAGLAAREFGTNIMNAIDAKGLMAGATSFFSGLKTQIANAMPAFTAIATVVRAAFAAVWEVVTVVFSAITGSMGVTSENWMTTFLEWSAIATWAFEQWPDIMTLAFVNTQLSLVRTGNDFSHFFTGVIPALLSWFSGEWLHVFTDIANISNTVFLNISKNIMTAMTAVWNFIKSGGTASMQGAFVPLMDGFKSTIKTLPDIPERAVTELERQLQADSERLGESLGGSLQQKIDANMQMLEKFKADQAAYVAPTLDGAHGPGDTSTDSTAGTGEKKRTNFAMDSLDKGSESALKAIFASAQQDKAGQQQLTEAKTTNKHLAKLVAMKAPSPAVQGAV